MIVANIKNSQSETRGVGVNNNHAYIQVDGAAEVDMAKKVRWLRLFTVVAIGVMIGAAGILISAEVNERTSTNAFCTSCHTMASLAADPRFRRSAHISNGKGMHASCGDCHIPSNNWFVETYTHLVKGTKDVISQYTHDFSDPKAWEAYRIKLAHFVRKEMREQDSITCRGCHQADGIHPASEAGQAAHALLKTQKLTCIDCHFNLVHAPVPPDLDFIRGSGLGVAKEASQ